MKKNNNKLAGSKQTSLRSDLSNFKTLSQKCVNFITETFPVVVDKEQNVFVFNDKCELLSNFLVLLITC